MKRFIPWLPGETKYITDVLTGRREDDGERLRFMTISGPKSDAQIAAEAKRQRKAAKYSQPAKGKRL